jgi:hypothetical protein
MLEVDQKFTLGTATPNFRYPAYCTVHEGRYPPNSGFRKGRLRVWCVAPAGECVARLTATGSPDPRSLNRSV